jgi:hypothetical protein
MGWHGIGWHGMGWILDGMSRRVKSSQATPRHALVGRINADAGRDEGAYAHVGEDGLLRTTGVESGVE